ncbi:hypothetical protein ASG80_18885 [Agromyces sp. Soil535]|nr:hypothetical protein ASG80_18885 [Agromyces sp. Soil535]
MIILLITVIEFSRLWNIQATLTDAAGISARYAGIHHEDTDVIAKAILEAKAVPGLLNWSAATVVVAVDCDTSHAATSSITVSPGSITEWFSAALGSPITLSSTGKMPCG